MDKVAVSYSVSRIYLVHCTRRYLGWTEDFQSVCRLQPAGGTRFSFDISPLSDSKFSEQLQKSGAGMLTQYCCMFHISP